LRSTAGQRLRCVAPAHLPIFQVLFSYRETRFIEHSEGPSEVIDALANGWWEGTVLYAVPGVFFAYWWYLRLMAVFSLELGGCLTVYNGGAVPCYCRYPRHLM
jgi:hypothetical protein